MIKSPPIEGKSQNVNLVESFHSVRTCPACGSSSADTIGRSAPGWDTEIERRLFRHPDYEVKQCATCDLYFKNCVLSDEALDEYYRCLPFESFESLELFPTDHIVLSSVLQAAPGAKILDFGCGVGRILERLTRRNRCYGVELNERACKIARARGIEIIPESALSRRTECNFDFVILSDVYEHLSNPLRLLRVLIDTLKPGGILIISTGNGDAVRCREYLSHFWYFRAPSHLLMVSRDHIGWCARQMSVELIECHSSSHYSIPVRDRYGQILRSWLFEQFNLRPSSLLTQSLRLSPRIRRVEKWPVAPGLTCTNDHLVAVLKK